MNKLFIIGNLTKDPELRSTTSGTSVCGFTVAVNRRQRDQQEADYFRITAWRELGENCAKYLTKGKKVAIVGSVSVNTYTGNDGVTRAYMDVVANDIEFLSPKDQKDMVAMATEVMSTSKGFTDVTMNVEELPF